MTNLLPITALIAIILFTLREFFEAWRRYNTKDRIQRATRTLMAHELERNKWVIQNFRAHLSTLTDAHRSKKKIFLEVDINGKKTVGMKISDAGESSSTFASVHIGTLSGSLKEIAEFDEEMFATAINAYHAVNDLQHIHNSILSYVDDLSNNRKTFQLGFLEPFIDYAHKSLDEIE